MYAFSICQIWLVGAFELFDTSAYILERAYSAWNHC